MIILRSILIVVEALVSLLLIALVLVQKTRGEGLGLAFGSGMGESLFGSRAGNVLTKATVVLATIFVINTIALANLFSSRYMRASGVERRLQAEEQAQPAPTPPTGTFPATE